jgi:ribose-phosphate pyrophosphokinase
MEGISIFSGNSNLALADKICEYLNLSLGNAQVKTFSDGEIQIEIDENVRSKDVFVIQSTCAPVNDHLVELLLMIDALKRSSALRITAVVPYFGYARQDKKVAPRVPISAKLVANMLTVAGANRIITMDLHAGQIQGFFDIPVDNIFAAPLLIDYIGNQFNEDLVVVSPDAGEGPGRLPNGWMQIWQLLINAGPPPTRPRRWRSLAMSMTRSRSSSMTWSTLPVR